MSSPAETWVALFNAFSYGFGSIGLPVFAVPSAGDRVVVMGRSDTRHPEDGAHTEIHPPRFVATLRARPAVTSVDPTNATRVDVYVSGHGGGANRVPEGLSATLDQGGAGGGRIRDSLLVADQDLYERAGPFPSTPLLDSIAFSLTGHHLLGPVFPTAGPSAFPWRGLAPEEHAKWILAELHVGNDLTGRIAALRGLVVQMAERSRQ